MTTSFKLGLTPIFAAAAWLLAAGSLGACDRDNDRGLECGAGTIVVDGECVADDGESGGVSSGNATNPTTSEGCSGIKCDGEASDGGEGVTGEGDTGEVPATGGDDPDDPYKACYSGSDVECPGSERAAGICEELTSTCSALCGEDTDCPAPTSGSAVQRCDGGTCVLSCRNGLTCPSGMMCALATCRWPAP